MSLPAAGRGHDDPQALLDRLAAGGADALPGAEAAGAFIVERDRSLRDRMAGRQGRVSSVRLQHGSAALTLRLDDGRPLTAEAARVSGGVVISRRALAVGEWLREFADLVAAVAADRAGDAAEAGRALEALGMAPTAADVTVDAGDVDHGLAALPAVLAGRLPDEAAREVAHIAGLLRETLPRVAGSGEPEATVRRTATVYLPDTLRAYLALPAEWAATHVLPNGATAAAELIEQLGALAAAAERMRDAAVEQDATALLVNGRFITDRFSVSSLDLPPRAG